MKKIDILGWYNKRNVGDDAFQLVFSRWFRKHLPRFVSPPNVTGKDADVVIFGGGAVTSEYYFKSMNPAPIRLGIGIDVERADQFDGLSRQALDYTSFRSFADYTACRERHPAKAIGHCPDLAFALHCNVQPVLHRYRRTAKRAVGVFLTDYIMPHRTRDLYHYGPRADQFAHGMAGLLDKVAEKAEVFLLPSSIGSPGDDRRINMHVAAFMEKPVTVVEDYLSPQEMIDLIRECTATICMRFHSHVFSIIAGTPFVSVQFTKKVATLLQEFAPGLPGKRELYGVTRNPDGYFNFDHALDRTMQAFMWGDDEKPYMHAFAEGARDSVHKLEKYVLSRFIEQV